MITAYLHLTHVYVRESDAAPPGTDPEIRPDDWGGTRAWVDTPLRPSAESGDDPLTSELHTQPVDLEQAPTPDSHDRVAIFLSLTANPDQTAFERLLHESRDGFAAAAVISVVGEDRLDPREATRLSTAAAQKIKAHAAHSGRAEVHLAFHGPYTMALLVGRYLNTLRTVVYEWDGATPGRPRYTPALVLEPGVSGGPITEILLAQYAWGRTRGVPAGLALPG